jgi:predicted Zn-dependent peptidase
VAGGIDPDALLREAADAFGAMPAGSPHELAAPGYRGGVATKSQPGFNQTHVVLGFPIPPLTDASHHAGVVAAALFGEGMSSPLMDRVRERKGLVYYAACSADVSDVCGQFVIEASTSPEQLDEFVGEVAQLLREPLHRVDPVGLERAHNQIAVRQLEVQERPFRLLEEATQDLFVLGRVRSREERLEAIQAVGAAEVSETFARMLAQRPSVAVAGRVRKGAKERIAQVLGDPLLQPS